jgi:hypothetical protein
VLPIALRGFGDVPATSTKKTVELCHFLPLELQAARAVGGDTRASRQGKGRVLKTACLKQGEVKKAVAARA